MSTNEKMSVTVTGLSFAAMLGLVTLIWTVSSQWRDLGSEVKQNSTARNDVEARMRKVEATLANVANDVQWIRKEMERGHGSAR